MGSDPVYVSMPPRCEVTLEDQPDIPWRMGGMWYAVEDVHIAVIEDGKPAFSETLRGTKSVSFNAVERLELDISDLERVRLTYNGKRVEPLGSLSRERRLVFMHETQD